MDEELKKYLEDKDGWETINGDSAEFWNPEAGDELIGVSRGLRELETKLGTMTVLQLETPHGDYLVKGHKALRRYFPMLKEAGMGVWIKYNGMEKSQAGTMYHSYDVKVKRPPRGAPGGGRTVNESDFEGDPLMGELIRRARAMKGEATVEAVLDALEVALTEQLITPEDYRKVKEKLGVN